MVEQSGVMRINTIFPEICTPSSSLYILSPPEAPLATSYFSPALELPADIERKLFHLDADDNVTKTLYFSRLWYKHSVCFRCDLTVIMSNARLTTALQRWIERMPPEISPPKQRTLRIWRVSWFFRGTVELIRHFVVDVRKFPQHRSLCRSRPCNSRGRKNCWRNRFSSLLRWTIPGRKNILQGLVEM